jgi:hypothetical protein
MICSSVNGAGDAVAENVNTANAAAMARRFTGGSGQGESAQHSRSSWHRKPPKVIARWRHGAECGTIAALFPKK